MDFLLWYSFSPESNKNTGLSHWVFPEEWLWGVDSGMSGHVENEVIYKGPLFLAFFFAVRNFDRSSVRSRSFRRLNRAFSVLRRTKSGNTVTNETSEERDNARNSSVPQEGMEKSFLTSLLDSSWSLKKFRRGLDVYVSKCVYLQCALRCARTMMWLGAHILTAAYVTLIIQQQNAHCITVVHHYRQIRS